MTEDRRGAMPTKAELRQQVWAALERAGVVRFPGATGRIPNFAGAERAAEHVTRLPEWRAARVLKVNPDYAQHTLRTRALREGKTLYMAVPRLRAEKPFLELDPARLGPTAMKAASIAGAFRYGRPIGLDEMAAIELIVCGAVAVDRHGGRLGKGGGFSDLEYALAVEAGLAMPDVPIVTTIHPLQLLDGAIPMAAHDISVDVIATPDGVTRCQRAYSRPTGIIWELLSEEQMASMPVLQQLRARSSS